MTGKKNNNKRGRKVARFRPDGVVPPLLPATRTVNLVWTSRRVYGESGVASGGNYTYAINNLYDPDKTGIGTQPINFDQMCALYTLFRVIQVDYDIEFVNVTTAASSTATVGVVPSWNDALPTDVIAWMGLPRSKQRMLSNLGGSNYCKMIGSVKPWQILSIPKAQYMSSPDYTCTASGSPARNVYLSTFCIGSGAAAAILSTIRFVFTVQCMIPVLNGFS